MTYRVVHYINQFFAGIGGEEEAGQRPLLKEGVVGPGQALAAAFGDEAQIVATVICGDGYFAENMDRAAAEVVDLIASCRPDAVVAGPAFNAGRYGTACGAVCQAVKENLGLPTVTAMYPENPGVDLYRSETYIVETTDSARGLRKAVPTMASLALKLLRGETPGLPSEEGTLPQGRRRNLFRDACGAERAAEMLVRKLRGEHFETEYPMPVFDRVPPAGALKNLKEATIALVTSGGIVPKGNPDHIEASSASRYGEYDISGVDDLTAAGYGTAHGGYDPTYADGDADRVLPVDVLREMEREGRFAKLHDFFYSTVGNGTPVALAARFGREIAEKLRNAGVDAVILTST
jgi:glycine reductase